MRKYWCWIPNLSGSIYNNKNIIIPEHPFSYYVGDEKNNIVKSHIQFYKKKTEPKKVSEIYIIPDKVNARDAYVWAKVVDIEDNGLVEFEMHSDNLPQEEDKDKDKDWEDKDWINRDEVANNMYYFLKKIYHTHIFHDDLDDAKLMPVEVDDRKKAIDMIIQQYILKIDSSHGHIIEAIKPYSKTLESKNNIQSIKTSKGKQNFFKKSILWKPFACYKASELAVETIGDLQYALAFYDLFFGNDQKTNCTPKLLFQNGINSMKILREKCIHAANYALASLAFIVAIIGVVAASFSAYCDLHSMNSATKTSQETEQLEVTYVPLNQKVLLLNLPEKTAPVEYKRLTDTANTEPQKRRNK